MLPLARTATVFTLLCLLAGSVTADERLKLLQNISAAGAPLLTLEMLDQAQPGIDEDLYAWILWEQERLSILARWKQWDQLLVRIEAIPADIPDQFKHQVATYRARAFLELGQTRSARAVLREQIWQNPNRDAADNENWRRLIIESYLRDGRTDDARVAMLRFDQDFDSKDIDWLLLRASVLIESGRHQQAITLLEAREEWQAKLIVMLAAFRSGQVESGELWRQVVKADEIDSLTPAERASLWSLGYFAALEMSPVDRVVALEARFQSGAEATPGLFDIPVDRLWQAYLEYAELVGNRAALLVGADEQWLDLADGASKTTPVKARALYAMLMLRSDNPDVGNRAAEGYMATFEEVDEREHRLLENLFNRSDTFADARKIPAGIRFQLVDLALKSANIEEATRLMSGLDSVPTGSNRFDWQLRRSRVLILGGRYDEGNAVLEGLINEYSEAEPEATDRILQVLFDLQTVELHAEAIRHFDRLLRLPLDAKRRREILYWIGDSYSGLGQHQQAALLYLQSAMLPAPDAMDPWAQTARYNAAESLQAAGLIDDARRIYQALLRVTDDPARRSVLSHKIQQLWLSQAAE